MGYFENENFYTTDAQIARYVDTVYFDRKNVMEDMVYVLKEIKMLEKKMEEYLY